MIFADKLIALRKKEGWSQEELAQQLNVSRQSVSKWEGAQSVPDLDKIVQLSRIFGVSTDYLLKDELEEQEPAPRTCRAAAAPPCEHGGGFALSGTAPRCRAEAGAGYVFVRDLTHSADFARRIERVHRPHHRKCGGWHRPERPDRAGRRRSRHFPDVRREGEAVCVSGNRAV